MYIKSILFFSVTIKTLLRLILSQDPCPCVQSGEHMACFLETKFRICIFSISLVILWITRLKRILTSHLISDLMSSQHPSWNEFIVLLRARGKCDSPTCLRVDSKIQVSIMVQLNLDAWRCHQGQSLLNRLMINLMSPRLLAGSQEKK